MTLREQIADKIDFLSDHWVNGDDNKPFQFGGWREEVLDELLKIFEERGLDDLDVAVFKTRSEMNKYFKHPRFAATFESKLRKNFIEAQKEAVEKYH